MPDDAQPYPLPFPERSSDLVLDPEVLALELAQELLGDPLDELDTAEPTALDVAAECDAGIAWLSGSQEQRMPGLPASPTPHRRPTCTAAAASSATAASCTRTPLLW